MIRVVSVVWIFLQRTDRYISLNTMKPSAPQKLSVQTVTLTSQVNGEVTEHSEPRSFDVVPLRKGALEGAEPQQVADNHFSSSEKLADAARHRLQLSRAVALLAIRQIDTKLLCGP